MRSFGIPAISHHLPATSTKMAREFLKKSSDFVAKIGSVLGSTFSIEGFQRGRPAPSVTPPEVQAPLEWSLKGRTSPAPLCDARTCFWRSDGCGRRRRQPLPMNFSRGERHVVHQGFAG